MGWRAARPGVLGGGVEGGPGEVEAHADEVAAVPDRPCRAFAAYEALRFDPGEQPERLGVALEAAAVRRELVQRLFAVVPEGRVAQVVREAGRLDEVGVAAEGGAQFAADLGALQGVRQAGAGAGVPDLAAGAGRDHLGLAGEASQRGGVQDAGAVALEGGAARPFVGFGGPAVDCRRVVGGGGGVGGCGAVFGGLGGAGCVGACAFHASTVSAGTDNLGGVMCACASAGDCFAGGCGSVVAGRAVPRAPIGPRPALGLRTSAGSRRPGRSGGGSGGPSPGGRPGGPTAIQGAASAHSVAKRPGAVKYEATATRWRPRAARARTAAGTVGAARRWRTPVRRARPGVRRGAGRCGGCRRPSRGRGNRRRRGRPRSSGARSSVIRVRQPASTRRSCRVSTSRGCGPSGAATRVRADAAAAISGMSCLTW